MKISSWLLNQSLGYSILVMAVLFLASCSGGAAVARTSIPTSLSFSVEPSNTTPAGTTNGFIVPAVKVQVLDANGNICKDYNQAITLTIKHQPNTGIYTGLLSGITTVNAVNGVATFESLSISQIGTGYTLKAAAGLSSAISTAFNVSGSTAGFSPTHGSEGAEIAYIGDLGNNFQGYVQVYIAQEPNPIPESAFATYSNPGYITNTPRLAIFDYSKILGSPNAPVGPLIQYVDEYGYTWGYLIQTQNFDWPFNPNNYSSPQPSNGWQAGQTIATVPAGVIKYSNINKNQLYIFSALDSVSRQPILRYFITDPWGNVYIMKSTNSANNTPQLLAAAFESAVLPAGWTKSTAYLTQDLYGYPIYVESTTTASYNDFRDSADNAYTQILWGSNGNSVAQQIGNPMPIYAGTAGARINGSESGNSLLFGSNGDDQFYPESGGNLINGGGGYNGVFYLNGTYSQYTITESGASTIVVGPYQVNDILTHIQYLQFSDKMILLETN